MTQIVLKYTGIEAENYRNGHLVKILGDTSTLNSGVNMALKNKEVEVDFRLDAVPFGRI